MCLLLPTRTSAAAAVVSLLLLNNRTSLYKVDILTTYRLTMSSIISHQMELILCDHLVQCVRDKNA